MELSVIIPAYNEEKRIAPFLGQLLEVIKEERQSEVIVVNDGSADKTEKIIREKQKDNPLLKLVTYQQNRGKGWAVKQGVEKAEGNKIIFIDADGSIPAMEIPEMLKKLEDFDVVLGDRSSPESEITQPILRKITGTIFNNYVKLLFSSDINDNLCGFKGFKKSIAKEVFCNLYSPGWIFDVEILYKIRKKKYKVHMLPIHWVHKEETKMGYTDPLKMAWELLILRWKLLKDNR